MKIFNFFKQKSTPVFNWRKSGRYDDAICVNIEKYWGASVEESLRNRGEWTAEINSSDLYFSLRRLGFSSVDEAKKWVEKNFETLKKISEL